MPWKETCAMDQRVEMIGEYLKGELNVSELARYYGVSRKTIYKWVRRYERDGTEGLKEHSRAPWAHPNAVAADIVREVVETRLAHQRWGPKKLLAHLSGHKREVRWPAASTMGELLKRQGLVVSRKRRQRTPPYSLPLAHSLRPNDVWSADFKGHFRVGDGTLIYPLTVSDNFSRYLLLCQGLSHTGYLGVRPYFEWLFREYGLPLAIRTDNGPPFASVGAGGLSELSAWFIRLGIRHERIEVGHPEQNGRHERLHRTLKEATAKPPRASIAEQQVAFNEFKTEYNNERPHEALGQTTPASLYYPSPTPYPERVREISYSPSDLVRRIRSNGQIRWRGGMVYLSEALVGQRVALRKVGEGLFGIYFSFIPLAILNEQSGKVTKELPKNRQEVLPICPV